MACTFVAMSDTNADYGFDAPLVPALLGGLGLLALAIGIVLLATGSSAGGGLLVMGAVMTASALSFVYTTRIGKFRWWAKILDGLALRGDEEVLDMGCGRGAVLVAVAKRVPRGTATGIDLWRSVDQSGNAPEVTTANATAEGVVDRVELRTGNMLDMPFADDHFDLVVSSLAIHNIRDRDDRRTAVDEAVRVLRPGGRLAIADIQAGKVYAERLTELGLLDVHRTSLGPTSWFGGPWMSTSLVTGTKPPT